MNKKILAFVYDGKKFLALRNNSQDLSHGGDFWFAVTGSLEKGESEEDAIRREVLEETGLIVKGILNLNWSSIYSWGNQDHKEKNFIAFVETGKVKLSEEHTEYEWLILENFIKKIKWDLDLNELRNVLQKGINEQLYFKKIRIDDFRNK
jgi:8-oxo-dGTP pyrophosphatase MutT (NUDIX family)